MKRFLSLVILLLATVSVVAQSKYYDQRVSQFDTLPVHSNSLVFLGDGLMDGCEWHEMFCNRHIKNRGIADDRSSWIVNRLDTIVGGRPKKLFLMVGINDLLHGVAPSEIASNIDRIIRRFEKESPWTRIFVHSLLPADLPDEPRLGELIIRTNRMIGVLCEERKNVLYIDVYSVLSDSRGLLDPQFTNDGLHLNGAGYLAWKELIEKHVK